MPNTLVCHMLSPLWLSDTHARIAFVICRFYPARYHLGMRSVFAMGDICSLIPNDEADVCILEEPEVWYIERRGRSWTTTAPIIMTYTTDCSLSRSLDYSTAIGSVRQEMVGLVNSILSWASCIPTTRNMPVPNIMDFGRHLLWRSSHRPWFGPTVTRSLNFRMSCKPLPRKRK